MKHSLSSRLLSAVLVLVMVISMFPVPAIAEGTAAYKQITSMDELTTGQYVMAVNSGYAPTVLDGSWILAEAVTATDGVITAPAANLIWTITVDGTNVKLTDSNGVTIAPKGGNNNGIKSGDYNWTVTCTDGTFAFAGQGSDTVVLASNKGSENKFRGYKTATVSGNANGYPSNFTLYKLEEAAEPARESGIVTDLTTLQDGDSVVVFNPANLKALSTTYSGYYNKGIDVTVTDGVLSGYTDAEVWTLGISEDGTYTFSTAEGKKLSMGASYTSTPLDDVNTGWEINVAATADCFYIQNPARDATLEYQPNYGTWSSYYSINDESLFAQQIYLIVEDSGETPEPEEPEEPEEPTGPIKDGDQVVIYAPGYMKALSATKTGNYNVGIDVAVEGDTLTGFGETEIWTVIDNGDGSFSFANGGQNIGMADSYSSMNLGAVHDDWTLTDLGNGLYNIKNVGRGNFMEWYAQYSNWSTYNSSSAATDPQFQLTFYVIPEEATGPVANGNYVIWAPAYNMALSSNYSGFYNAGTAVTMNGDKLTGYSAADIWTVTNNDDGTISIAFGGQNLGMADSFSSMTLGEAHDKWVLEDAGNGLYYVKNTVRGAYIEWYASKNNWSGYNYINSGSEGMFALKFTPAEAIEQSGSLNEGDQVVIYNLAAKGVLAAQNDTLSIENALAEIVDGKAVPENGGVVFTVERNGDYYRFYNETYGYLCSNGTGNNAFYTQEASEDADWTLSAGKKGGYNLESRTAKFNGQYSQYLEYYADAYKTYSMYNVTDYDIYEFFFYELAEGVNVTGSIVNNPSVVFGTLPDAYVGTDYTFSFTVDSVFGVDGEPVVKVGETVLTANADGSYTIPAELVVGESLTITVSCVDTKGNQFSGTATVTVKDEPVIGAVTPAAGSQTGEGNLRPVISAEISNAGEGATYTMTVGGETVEAVFENGVLTYTPAADMAEGRTTVTVTVVRTDGKEATKTWSFTVGKAQFQLYFGQLHSHTTYSDGSGSLESALTYIKNLPDSANVDFVAFTDHSNYFDASGAANPEAALYDMSLATAASQKTWSEYVGAMRDFNASQSEVIAIPGFEMTWSGGPGHINTFNTPGIVSRNNTTLNNKTSDAGMKAYYTLLSDPKGADSISQFNHPGSTFGTFSDFAYWDALIDTRIQLVEVGNGEGQIGAGGYYPSYEYYTMALDKGWHVSPTNNQDNHKGKWGNANDARDVILTDDFSEEGIYAAIRAMRMYSTEDKNLEIGYTVNGMMLGSIIEEVPEKLDLNVTVFDPDSSDSISKVEVIVNSGKVAYTWDDPTELANGALTATLEPTFSYYYIRVTEGDGDLAVTSPVWVGESLKLGISSVESSTTTPVTDEELTLTTTLFNSESTAATVKSLTYSVKGGAVIGTDSTGYQLPASGTLTVDFAYTPEAAKLTVITVTAVVELDGEEYVFTMDIELDIQDADKLVYIGVDASHFNEYVNGNYRDSMGNFTALAAEYGVRVVILNESEDLIAACSNEKYKAIVLTAPSRRNGNALRDPYLCYSDAEIAALTAFNAAGGTLVLTGWGDYYESYTSFPAEDHMAAQQNKILEAVGSSIRISDDETKDDTHNGGQAQRLYLSVYDFDNFLLDGVEYDAEHPHDNMYTELYSQYGGASIYVVDAAGNPTATVPGTVTPAVYGFETTYSADDDKDNYGGLGSTQKYAVGDTENLMVLATEQLPGQGLIVVAGAAFLSNFEVQATIEDSGAEKNYSNYKICENLLKAINPVVVTPIAEVQAQTETGFKYTIEGVVTSNASGYDKDTAFFDCIYVQDATGGICCFPVAGNFKIGDLVRVTGTTEFYQGEMELQVSSIEVIGEGTVEPKEVTAAQVNDLSVIGQLITVKGTVVSYELANGLVQTIMVKDENGETVRVFIDGYITTEAEVANLALCTDITVTGIASYDNTFNAPDGPFPRIRIRNRADIVCEADVMNHTYEAVVTEPTCTEGGYTTYTCSVCGHSYVADEVDALGHTYEAIVTEPTCTEGGYTTYTCSVCGDTYVADEVDALGHSFGEWTVTTEPTCTEKGEEKRTCACGETETREVDALGHSYEAVVTEPTCTEGGYTTYTCSVCGDSYVADETEALGHEYESVVTDPTATEQGYTTHTCKHCGESYVDSYVEPIPDATEPETSKPAGDNDSADTGDKTPLTLMIVLMSLSLAALIVIAIIFFRRKKK